MAHAYVHAPLHVHVHPCDVYDMRVGLIDKTDMKQYFLSGAQQRSRARRRDRRAGGTTIHPIRLNKPSPFILIL